MKGRGKIFYVIWEIKHPTWPVTSKDEEDQSWKEGGYQPPTWYVREFDKLWDAILYYLCHREKGIEAKLVKNLSNEKINNIWQEAK